LRHQPPTPFATVTPQFSRIPHIPKPHRQGYDGEQSPLRDSDADLGALRQQFHSWPKEGLKEVMVIDREGNVVHLYP